MPQDIFIKGKLLNQYIYSFLALLIIVFLLDIFFAQTIHIYISLGLCILLVVFIYLKDQLKNNTFFRFCILFGVSFLIFIFDSYYSPTAMVFLSYVTLVGTFPVVLNLNKDKNYIIILFLIIAFQIILNISTDYNLFRNENLTTNDIEFRRGNEVFQLVYFITMNVYFIYKLQTAKLLHIKEKSSKVLERLPVPLDSVKELQQLAITNNPIFLSEFRSVFPDFEIKLLELAPNMIISELEICAFVKLNITTKEIASYTKSSIRAVEGKKYRIRKKLALDKETDLYVYINKI
jgi:DNA-binding CsgD family transcriptional regulator